MSAPTLTPTHENGTTAQASAMVYVPPERQMTPDRMRDEMEDTGLNLPFVADLLSAMTAHERCGRHLYRSVAGRTNNPVLKRKYEEFGEETEAHVAALAEIVVAMGGDPQYVSPMARATEGQDTKLLESTFMLSGSLDTMTSEMAMLDAVLVAETIDHANWSSLSDLVAQLPAGTTKDSATAVVSRVMEQEDDHLEWARTTRARMTMLQAQSSTAAAMSAKAEELVETVRGWFSD
jgi:rubrerythrin